MTTPRARSALIELIQARVNITSNDRQLSAFNPAAHKYLIGETVAGAIVHVATAGNQTFASSNVSYIHPFWELLEAGISPIECDGLDGCIRQVSVPQAAEEIYEAIIPLDFPVSGSVAKPSGTSTTQKLHGTYYTPPELAAACTAISFDMYIARNLGLQEYSRQTCRTPSDLRKVKKLLCATRIADLSCGVARFLVAAVNYVHDHVARHLSASDRDELAEALARNLNGFDVDPVAIGLSRLRVLEAVSRVGRVSDCTVLFRNFVHANPLIQRNGPYEARLAVTDYLQGFLYSSRLGRPSDFTHLTWDLTLGNPPWEKIRLEERSFFDHFMQGIVSSSSKGGRKHEISELEKSLPHVFAYYQRFRRQIDDARKQIQSDSAFLNSSRGELNTCALFSELALRSLRSQQAVGALLVKTSILTHYAHRRLFAAFQETNSIAAVYDFVNRAKYFPIDSRERFAWFIFGGSNRDFTLAMHLEDSSDLWDASKVQQITRSLLELLNPSTGMIPSVQSPQTMETLVAIYKKNSIFADEYPTAKYGRIVHLTMHSDSILNTRGIGNIPIIEGKFIERYDGRFAGFDDVPKEHRFGPKANAIKCDSAKKANPDYVPESRYFLRQEDWVRLTATFKEPWSIFWRSTTSFSNARTCIAMLLPHCPAIQSLQMLQLKGSPPRELALLLATINSKAFDFLVRNKLAGIDLTQNVIKQIAVPRRKAWFQLFEMNGITATIEEHVVQRVAYLLAEDGRLSPYVRQLGKLAGLQETSKSAIDQELDLLVARAYDLSPKELATVLENFGNPPKITVSNAIVEARSLKLNDHETKPARKTITPQSIGR